MSSIENLLCPESKRVKCDPRFLFLTLCSFKLLLSRKRPDQKGVLIDVRDKGQLSLR